jgi:hypothetical protein
VGAVNPSGARCTQGLGHPQGSSWWGGGLVRRQLGSETKCVCALPSAATDQCLPLLAHTTHPAADRAADSKDGKSPLGDRPVGEE